MDTTAKAENRHQDRLRQLEEPYKSTPDDLRLLNGHLAGHEWQPLGRNGFRTVCSCG